LPESVRKSKELEQRKPALLLSLVAVASLILGIGFFFTKGAEIATAKAGEVTIKSESLSKYDKAPSIRPPARKAAISAASTRKA
jgi:hypothetical protein